MTTQHVWRMSLVLCSISVVLFLGLGGCGPAQPEQAEPAQPEQVEPVKPEQAEPIKLKGVIPGKTTRDEVINNLGEPVTSQMEEGMEALEYPSAHELMPNVVLIKDGVVVLTGTALSVADNVTVSGIIAKYGEPDKKTYSLYAQWTLTYIYPNRGLALIVDEAQDIVFFEQCFIPMSVEEYMQTWGKDLPLEDPYIK